MHSKKHSMIAFPRFKLPYSTNSSMRHSQCSALQSSRRLNSRTHSQWKVRTSHPFNTNWQTAVESKIYVFSYPFCSLALAPSTFSPSLPTTLPLIPPKPQSAKWMVNLFCERSIDGRRSRCRLVSVTNPR